MGSIVQKVAGPGEVSSSSNSTAFGSNNTGGNSIIGVIRSEGSVIPGTMYDSNGNSYSQVIYAGNGTYEGYVSIWRADGIASGANTVSIPITSGACLYSLDIYEATPLGIVDQMTSAIDSGAGTTTPSCGPVTTTGNGELCICASANGGNAYASSAGSGWTLDSVTTGTYFTGGTESQIQVSAGSLTGNMTLNSSYNWSVVLVTFVFAVVTPGKFIQSFWLE